MPRPTPCLVRREEPPVDDRLEGDGAVSTGAARADCIRAAIDTAGLTLYRVSALTARRGRGAIGHTFYRDVRAGQTPTIYQLAALAQITDQPIDAWLRCVDVDLSMLTTLQMALHAERTIRLPRWRLGPAMDVTRWLQSPAQRSGRIERLTTAGESPSQAPERRSSAHRFLYLRVGGASDWLLPEIAPGSIVRVDRRQTGTRFDGRHAVHAVAHAQGLSCCYVDALSATQVALFGANPHAAPVVGRLGHDVIILGRVDAELRTARRRADTPGPVTKKLAGPVGLPDARRDRFGRFVQRSRALLGMTLRDAQALADAVAIRCGDAHFRLSLGGLANYETLATAPASPHALFTVAAIYAAGFEDLLTSSGIRARVDEPKSRGLPPIAPETASALDLPASLELYTAGTKQKLLDSRLAGAVVLAVDPRDRRLSPPDAEAPLVLLRLPNDALVCCAASSHEGRVLVQPAPDLGLGPRLFPRDQVEVVGRVAAILRRLPH